MKFETNSNISIRALTYAYIDIAQRIAKKRDSYNLQNLDDFSRYFEEVAVILAEQLAIKSFE